MEAAYRGEQLGVLRREFEGFDVDVDGDAVLLLQRVYLAQLHVAASWARDASEAPHTGRAASASDASSTMGWLKPPLDEGTMQAVCAILVSRGDPVRVAW